MRDDSQHFSTVVNTIGYIFNDCLSDYKVPAVNAVVDSLSLQHWSEVVSDPIVVECAKAYKDIVLEIL